MDDLIFRKAAIEAMQKLEAEDIETYGVSIPEGFDGERAVKALKELPAIMQMPSGAVITDEMFDFCSSVEKMQEKINEIINSAGPEIIRCKDCKHRIVNENYGKKGYMNLKAMCELDSGDPFELSRCAEDDEWFCADAERR